MNILSEMWTDPKPWAPKDAFPVFKAVAPVATAPSTKEVEEYFRAINAKMPPDPPGEYGVGFNALGGKKFDGGKPDYTLLPFEALEDTVKVLGFGAVKYGRDNWQKVEPQRYVAAAFRHLVAIAKGEEFDEESGLTHAAHLACCALFLGRQYS